MPPEDIQYTLTRSRRRTLSVSVDDDNRVEVRAPRWVSTREIRDFVLSRRRWIWRCLDENRRIRERYPVPRFVAGERFLYLGRGHRLEIAPALFPHLAAGKGRLSLMLPPGPASPACVRALLIDWYRRRAEEVIPARAAHFARRLEVRPATVRVKALKSIWGSCSPKGRLSFSWSLIMAPPGVLDAVVVHELCHLFHLDHSPAFWCMVQACIPDYSTRSNWLKTHKPILKALESASLR